MTFNRHVAPTIDLNAYEPQPVLTAQPVHNDSLAKVRLGKVSDTRDREERQRALAAGTYHDTLRDVLRFGIQLVLHPGLLPIAASLIQCAQPAHPLVSKAIHYVFATTSWRVLLDDMPKTEVAKHYRYSHVFPEYRYQELAIHINTWYLEKLLHARDTDHGKNGNVFARHFFHLGMAVAREFIHVLRLQVFHTLQPYPEVTIPLTTPPQGGSPLSEAGSAFEGRVLGGHIEGVWDVPDGYARYPRAGLVREPEPDGQKDWDLVSEEEAEQDEEVRQVQSRPFDHVVIHPPGSCDNTRYKIDDDWLRSALQAFRLDNVKSLSFPAKLDTEPLNNQTLCTVFRDWPEKCVREHGVVLIRRRHVKSE